MDWKIKVKFDCPPKFIALVQQLHDGMLTEVQYAGEFFELFPVINGLNLAPTLFSDSLMDAFKDVMMVFQIPLCRQAIPPRKVASQNGIPNTALSASYSA